MKKGAANAHFAQFWCNVSPFRMNTCKSVSKQRTLTPFRMNTYEKQGEEHGLTIPNKASRTSDAIASGGLVLPTSYQSPSVVLFHSVNILLNEVECRVLGALIEKEITTPEYYPLSLNALVNACNQKSNHDPVMTIDEASVR